MEIVLIPCFAWVQLLAPLLLAGATAAGVGYSIYSGNKQMGERRKESKRQARAVKASQNSQKQKARALAALFKQPSANVAPLSAVDSTYRPSLNGQEGNIVSSNTGIAAAVIVGFLFLLVTRRRK